MVGEIPPITVHWKDKCIFKVGTSVMGPSAGGRITGFNSQQHAIAGMTKATLIASTT